MKILYAASEAAPYAKSGGLADVAGALPKALVHDGIDCRVIMPLYGDLKFKDTLTYVTNFSVPVGWRSQYCGLFKAEHDGVTFYFIDNEYYFKRSGLYGFYDDGERFAFFSRAILETLFYTDFEPDIIRRPVGDALRSVGYPRGRDLHRRFRCAPDGGLPDQQREHLSVRQQRYRLPEAL